MSARNRWRDRIYESIGLKEWQYARLDQSEDNTGQPPRPNPPALSSSWPRGKYLKIGGAVLLLIILIGIVFRSSPSSKISNLIFKPEIRSSYLYLILPATKASSDFCKTVFSAAALDYPTPRIINWDKEFDDANLVHGGADVAKIEGIYDFLKQLSPSTDSDLAIIADGDETWFQLRPSVLIDRYYAINERANQRIRQRLGRAATKENITQSILFSAQRKCSSSSPDHIECYAVPESDLPTDVYGSQTDREAIDKESGFSTYRQRYLHTGTIVGPIGDLRKLFEKATEKAKEESAGSDQAVFARMFGEQEYQREVIRARHLSWNQKFFSWFSRDSRSTVIASHPTHEPMEELDGTPCEFGIGLDYYGEISQPPEFSSKELKWISHNSTEAFREAARKSGVSSLIPSEVEYSTPPFWTADYTGQTKVPDKDWSQVPLFTNMWTGVSPVAIQLRTHREGIKDWVGDTWEESWFLPYLRPILVTKSNSYRMPVAYVTSLDGRPEEWWGPEDWRGGVRIETGNLPGAWKWWDDDVVCGTSEIADDVFTDGRGAWGNPQYYVDHDKGMAEGQLKNWEKQWAAFQDGRAGWGEKDLSGDDKTKREL